MSGYTNNKYYALRIVTKNSTDNINEILQATPLTIAYEKEAEIAPFEIDTSKYTVRVDGSETVIQGEIDNSQYGANPTITQEYIRYIEVWYERSKK